MVDKCTCDEDWIEGHTCPFKSDIDNDDSECDCCDYCMEQCSDNR